MTDRLHEIRIQAQPSTVLAALTTQAGLGSWWTGDSVAEPKVGAIAEFGFGARLRRLETALFATALLALAAATHAAGPPYNEAANAAAELERALAAASAAQKPVLVIFGANWCEDCRALDSSLKQKKNADLISQTFQLVKVDVGNFNRNLDVNARYGNPIKNGIPAAVILSPKNQVLYATRAGELSSARRMSESGVYEFFRKAAAAAKEGK